MPSPQIEGNKIDAKKAKRSPIGVGEHTRPACTWTISELLDHRCTLTTTPTSSYLSRKILP